MNHRARHRQSDPWAVVGVMIIFFFLVAATSSCSMDEMSAGVDGYENQGGAPGDSSKLHEAEAELENHRVDEARALYDAQLMDYPADGRASAGVGVTNLLLALEMDEFSELLVEYLRASSGVDANALFFAEGGYLYWRSRGARSIDDGQSAEGYGVLSLVEDELPWTSQQVASLTSFVEGLDEPMAPMIRQLRSAATGLMSIDQHLEMAIDDEGFTRLYIPGAVFHDSKLALQLGRGELSMLRAAIALLRSAVYFLEAYENKWTLEGAFGAWRLNVGLDHPSYSADFGAADYTVSYLDGYLLREVTNPDRLSASRLALREGISHFRSALHHGVEQSYSTTLGWDAFSEDEIYEMDLFLEAVADSLDGPTELPHLPGVTVDLSPLFEDGGRVLGEDMDWLVRKSGTGEDFSGAEDLDEWSDHWSINNEALQEFLLEGVVEPMPEADDELAGLIGPSEGLKAFVEGLSAEYRTALEDVYLQTR